MKNSKYNYIYSFKNHKYVYNLRLRKIVECPSLDFLTADTQYSKKLYEMGFLLEDDVNELLLLKKEYYKAVSSKRMHLVVMVTNNCNFNCKYCYEKHNSIVLGDETINNMLDYIRKELSDSSGLFVEWFGGEPLLFSDKVIETSQKIKEICKEMKKPYIGSITTNGYYLSEKCFGDLIKSGIVFFQVTLDGNKVTHDYLRPLKNGNGSFETIINNIISIRDRKGRGYFSFVIRNNIYEENVEGVNEFLDFYEKELGSDRRFQVYQFAIKDWGGNQIHSLNYEKLFNNNIVVIEKNKSAFSDILEPPEAALCYAVKEKGVVIAEGEHVYKCSHQIDNKTALVGQWGKGSSIQWNQPALNNFLQRDISVECRECEVLPYCLYEKCPLIALRRTSDCKIAAKKEIDSKIYNYLNEQEEKIDSGIKN